MITDFTCTLSRIALDIPHQIWEAQSLHPVDKVFLARLLHNKLLFWGDNLARCYFSYFSPEFLTQALTLLGMILFFVGLYLAVSRKNKFLIMLIFAAPLFPLFELGPISLRTTILYLGYVVGIIYTFYKFTVLQFRSRWE